MTIQEQSLAGSIPVAASQPPRKQKSQALAQQISDSSVFLDRPSAIEDEMFRLSAKILNSEKDANFAIKELLPTLTTDGTNESLEIILHDYEKFKKEEER